LINISEGQPTELERRYLYPDLSAIIGYTHPNYGQSGLEASLDPYLRGLQGNPARLIWIDHLLYGQPPSGLDVRLSINLNLQQKADFLLGNQKGAIVLLNASTGEILVMASHPTFNANHLEDIEETLLADPVSPLLNRAAQGVYPLGNSIEPFLNAAGISEVQTQSALTGLFRALGLFSVPELRLPVSDLSIGENNIQVSPLQMALATATLSAEGVRPVPRLAMAVNTPTNGWVVLPGLGESVTAFTPEMASQAVEPLLVDETPF
jgi:cell division protein FtsI/penicillin-binding protein 2